MTNTEINEIAEKEIGFPGLVTNSGLSRKCDPLELLTFVLLPSLCYSAVAGIHRLVLSLSLTEFPRIEGPPGSCVPGVL